MSLLDSGQGERERLMGEKTSFGEQRLITQQVPSIHPIPFVSDVYFSHCSYCGSFLQLFSTCLLCKNWAGLGCAGSIVGVGKPSTVLISLELV